MVARVQEMRAKLVEAWAQVPQAIGEAFRQGNIGVRDYYDLRDIQADTQRRESLATGQGGWPTCSSLLLRKQVYTPEDYRLFSPLCGLSVNHKDKAESRCRALTLQRMD